MKKNKVYVNKILKKINNNQKECEVIERNISEEKKELKKNVGELLDELLHENGYSFSKKVKIITNNREYLTSIAAKVNNTIITMDNDVIKINDIKDLIIM